MRRLELLINDIRFNSDNLKTTRYPNIRLMKLFSDAQRELQSMIVTNDANGKWFIKTATQDLVYAQEAYDLPTDIFALSYVLDVARAMSQGVDQVYWPLRLLTDKELRRELGYVLSNNQVLMTPLPTVNLSSGLRIKYVKQLPTLSIRVGLVSALSSGVSITVSGAIQEAITAYDDFVTVVDINGVIKQSNIRMTGYNQGTGVISTNTVLTAVATGDYVVVGRLATDHSELPDVCEGVLTGMVEKAIQRIDASQEFNWADLVTQEQKLAVLKVVQGAQHDNMYPPITDEDYLNT